MTARRVLGSALGGLVVLCLAALPRTDAAFTATTADGGSTIGARTGCSAPGPMTLYAEADAEIREDAPASNYGALTTITVMSALDEDRRVFVRFDLGAVPPWCAVADATLRLNASTSDSGRTIDVRPADAAWDEGSVTWATQPAATGALASSASATGWVTWDVTPAVTGWMSGSANHGFMLRDRTEDSQSCFLFSCSPNVRQQVYSSREAATLQPELVLTLVDV